jgi:hypothetical protein
MRKKFKNKLEDYITAFTCFKQDIIEEIMKLESKINALEQETICRIHYNGFSVVKLESIYKTEIHNVRLPEIIDGVKFAIFEINSPSIFEIDRRITIKKKFIEPLPPKPNLIQLKNPKGGYILIDKTQGKIIDHKETPYENI